MFCKKCGQENLKGKFCKRCGEPISIDNTNENEITNTEKKVEEAPLKVEKVQFSGITPIPKRKKVNNELNKKVILITMAIIAVVSAIVCTIFFDEIKGNYYLKKANESNIRKERKLEYAKNAVKSINNSTSRSVLEGIMLENINDNLTLVDEALIEVKEVLSEDEYKTMALKIKNSEFDYLCKNENYKEATPILGDLNELGKDFKENSNYSKVMIYNINNCTDSSLSSLDTIMNTYGKKIIIKNFDEDNFDEIVELEKKAASGDGEISINLFKYKDGAYTLVNNYVMVNSSYESLYSAEVFDYSKGKPAVFFKYRNMDESRYVSVATIEDSAIKIKNTVPWDKSAYIRDIDNDGRYDIGSSSTYSSNAEVWYRLNEDGSTSVIEYNGPAITNSSEDSNKKDEIEVNTNNYKSGEYIFANSNTRYLTNNDLRGLSKYQLSLARNEIFARHGYMFTLEEYKKYFNSKSWYVPNPSYVDNVENLNVYERANVELIQKWEAN